MPAKTALQTRLTALECRIADLREQAGALAQLPDSAQKARAVTENGEMLAVLETCRAELLAEVKAETVSPDSRPPSPHDGSSPP